MTPWPVACQAPLSIGFSRHKCWSGLPFPSPGKFPNPRIELESPAMAGRLFTTEPPGMPDSYPPYKTDKQQVLLCSTENYTQYLIIIYNGREYIHTHTSESLPSTPETNTTFFFRLFITQLCKSTTCVCVLVAQSHPTLCGPMDCSQPGSTVRGILQARILDSLL